MNCGRGRPLYLPSKNCGQYVKVSSVIFMSKNIFEFVGCIVILGFGETVIDSHGDEKII